MIPYLREDLPEGAPKPQNNPFHGPMQIDTVYQLRLTDTYRTFGPQGEPRETKGPKQWRLEYFEPEPWVNFDVAIRYLTKLRDESESTFIRANAANSIATLEPLRRTPTR